ncbi:hypothetical protein CLU92_5456 [Janthinobacterium sp. 61]|nr:hypothetical protein CLU92_5456 [Janthinobacterium sp. 61]
MHQNHFHTGIEFARAAVKHFNLPANTLAAMTMITGSDEVFGLAINIALTADDLAGIADHMDGRTPPAVAAVAAHAAHAVEELSINAWANERDTLLQGMSFDAWLCHHAGVAHAAEAIGFDAWMRERAECAHQAMMRHARRGGQPYGY